MVDSVLKGYQMLQLILAYFPLPLKAFITMSFGLVAVNAMVRVIKDIISQ